MPVITTDQPNTFTMDPNTANESTLSSMTITDRSDNSTGIFYTSKSDDPAQPFNASSSSEEANNAVDEAYIVPIKVILHSEHVHQSLDDNGTFLKFNYILMRTNDTSYHGHFENDETADRLKLLKNEISSDVASNDTDELDDSSSTTSSMSPMVSMDVLVDENGEEFDRINERTIIDENGVVVSQFSEIAWRRRNFPDVYESNDNQEVAGNRAMSSESDQENDRHYSQILTWIHFNL